jgi:hypothetical protein
MQDAKGFDTPLIEHKIIPEDDATSYDDEERTTEILYYRLIRQTALKVVNSPNWLYAGRCYGLTGWIA